MTFQDLGLIDPILKALTEQGYQKPSPIQEKAIGPALTGRDVLGCAQTGTGKTCAFAAPILQTLHARKPQGRPIRSLILTPTRELALQIQENFEAYGRYLPLRSAVIFGGVGQAPQVDKLKRGVDILVATPGRLMDLQGQGFIDLSKLEIFVLDEADRMLDMGFIHDVRKILKLLPDKKQTLFFSATMPPEITELVNSLLKNPVKVAVDPVSSPVEVIDQSVYLVDKANKSALLAKLMNDLDVKNALVFTRTKHGANKVAGDLEKAGIRAAAIHGNKSQTARQQALADFKRGAIRALVATDIAARGLDIEDLSHVFNYNLPEVPETYVHRIGRTGRAGKGGAAVAFCDFGEKPYLKDIEKLIGKKVPLVEDHPWPMQVFEAAVKDVKGRLVNADIAEARAAAKDRRRERDAANKAAAEAK
ncbi:MAG TPA: DEAD/DEAH box helicase, partial [Pseudoflavonifractor sp.]|nr:DEAD/DEAH box helicase [Pseudoflavonifractor sp.]